MKSLFFSLLTCLILCSCISESKWEKATIKYNDNTEKEAYVYASNMSYYNFIRAKFNLDERRIIYPPDSLISVTNDKFTYTTLFFDEERFGMESYGFIKRLTGNNLFIGVTKFKMKTCACKTSGGYFKGYFIVNGHNYEKVELDVKNRIKNINELNEFIEKQNIDFEIPAQVQNLDELIEIIEKVNI